MDFNQPTFYFELRRDYAVQRIHEGLEQTHRFLITGDAGVGKSTVAGQYWGDYMDKYTFAEVFSNDVEFYMTPFDKTLKKLSRRKRSFFEIDEFDRFDDPRVRDLVFNLMTSREPSNVDIILAARPHPDLQQLYNIIPSYHLPTFTDAERDELIRLERFHERLSPEQIDVLRGIVQQFDNNPTIIHQASYLFQIYKNTDDVFTPLLSGIQYNNENILTDRQTLRLIQPPAQQIITDIKTIERDFLALIKKNPQDIHNLSPRDFEEFIADLYRKQGFDVTLTQQSRDGGKDFIITNKSLLGNLLIYGQVKKNRPDRPVGISVIKELHSTVVMEKATAGIVVSSSYFSPDAQRYVQQIQHTMSLVDYVKLNQMIESIS